MARSERLVITPSHRQGFEVNPDIANIRFQGIDCELDVGLISDDGRPDSRPTFGKRLESGFE